MLTAEELDEIRPLMEERAYAPGQVLLTQGERMGRFHILVSGRVHVFIEGARRIRVATLEQGAFVGEMSTLTGNPVSATVEAAEPVVTLSVDQDGLLELMDHNRTLRQRLVRGLIERIGNSNSRIKQEDERSSVMAETLARSSAGRFGELLGDGLAAVRADVQRLAPLNVPVVVLGEHGTGKQHTAARLHQESGKQGCPFLIQEGRSFELDVWRRQCNAAGIGTIVLLHADELPPELLAQALRAACPEARVILTASTLRVPAGFEAIRLPPLRDRYADIPRLARHFLVASGVRNPEAALSGDALRLLAIYPYLAGNVRELEKAIGDAVIVAHGDPIRPEHLRLGQQRQAGGRPRVGLALGGGALRGAAHVGVLRVLEGEGVPIDFVAGTSAGAVAGIMYCSGLSVDQMDTALRSLRFKEVFRWTLPRTTLWDSTPVRRTLERHIGSNVCFADLRTPFACVAADAATGESVVMTAGDALSAVQASMALPMLVRPVTREKRVLVDGGVVQIVPAMVARSMGADLVIAVPVSVPGYAAGAPRNLFESLVHGFDMASQRLCESELEWADVVVRPSFGDGGQSLDQIIPFIKAGEEAARQALPRIRQRLAQLVERQG